MIGGPDAFGAGGWQGLKLEEVLPVNMDIPAQRQLPKGALVLVMHSCEMPDGNYWGEQCAIKAVETLSERDEIGVISYAWNGPGGGGANWDFPLQTKGDGSQRHRRHQAHAARRHAELRRLARPRPQRPERRRRAAPLRRRQKHVIVISDGDPRRPAQTVIDAYKKNKVSISTVTVYPHNGDPDGLPPTMKKIAEDTEGQRLRPDQQQPQPAPADLHQGSDRRPPQPDPRAEAKASRSSSRRRSSDIMKGWKARSFRR